MTVRELEAVFHPRSVALVAEEETPLARTLARHLSAAGMPVARADAPGGLASVPDLIVVAAPPARLPDLIAEAGRRGVKAAVLAGDHAPDAAVRDAVRQAARDNGIRVLGPASLGVSVPVRRFAAGAFHRAPQAGRVALVAQSGTLAGAVLDWALRRDVGFSHVAALGEMADVGFGEVLNYLALERECQAVLLVMDEVTTKDAGGARRFLSAARAVSRVKPVIVLRSGGRMGDGTPDAVFDAALRRAGVLRVHALDELFDALEALAVGVPVRGDRLAIIGNGRGIGRLAADAVLAGGGRLAGAPRDLGEGADGPACAAALRDVQGEATADAVLLLHAPTALVAAGDVARAVAEAMPTIRLPVLTSWLGERDAERAAGALASHRVPVFDTPDRAARAFLHMAAHRRNQDLLTQTPPSVPAGPPPDRAAAQAVIAAARAQWRSRLRADEAAALLAAYGVGDGLNAAMSVDPLFGPVLGVGGRVVLPPLNLTLAGEVLDGDAAPMLVRLGRLVAEREEVAALTLGPEGAVVDLLPPGVERTPMAIRPYPTELERPLPLPDGRAFVVRPVLPEDEPALKALFARLTADEVRLRFFAPKAELSHATAARMSQIDYDRDMGLVVAEVGAPGVAAVHGAVHLSADADLERAEFAIMLAHDMAGLGLGPVLMRRILDHARAKGLREVFGEVLMENRAMLRLCEALGFTRRMSTDDPGVVHVSLVK
ncbi:GNAT family N-acetyltransferase [Azospirillum sp. sgz301742]